VMSPRARLAALQQPLSSASLPEEQRAANACCEPPFEGVPRAKLPDTYIMKFICK
jgi:hypothetical protein